jgi:hypothetical protein
MNVSGWLTLAAVLPSIVLLHLQLLSEDLENALLCRWLCEEAVPDLAMGIFWESGRFVGLQACNAAEWEGKWG